MNRKIEPGLWKLHDPRRGNVWYTCWRGDTQITFSEDFAKLWLYKRQSQNVTDEPPGETYAEPADTEAQ